MVLCVDEKSQSRPWTAPRQSCRSLPGVPERRPTTTVRHGTTNLYAAFDVASGKVIANLTARHRAESSSGS